MAGDKKGFILYADLIHTVNQLPNDKAGQLFKHILSYVNDENPQSKDMIINVVFEPIKQQLKRDLKKYEGKKLQWSDAGKASAEARKQRKKETNERSTDSTNVKDRSTDSTVSVNDNVNVNVTDTVNVNATVIYDFEKDYKKNEKLIKAIQDNLFITQKQFSGFFNEFKIQYLEPLDEKGFNDAKKHFLNWLKIEIKKEKVSGEKEKSNTQIAYERGEGAKEILREMYEKEKGEKNI